MLTGRQIREARRLTTLAITRAKEAGDEPTLSAEQAAAVRQTLERLGVEFAPEGVRMRKSEP